MVNFELMTLLNELATQELAVGVFLIGSGLVFLLLGSQIFKPLLAISLGVFGFVIGGLTPLSQWVGVWTVWAASLLGALSLALIGLYYYRFALGLLCGIWGGLCVLGVLGGFEIRQEILLALAGIAFLAAVSLTIIMPHELLAWVTSLEGSLLVLCGLGILASQYNRFWLQITRLLDETPLFAPFLVLAVGTTGFYLQLAQLRQKETSS